MKTTELRLALGPGLKQAPSSNKSPHYFTLRQNKYHPLISATPNDVAEIPYE